MSNFKNEIQDLMFNFIAVPRSLYKSKLSGTAMQIMLYFYDKPSSWSFNQQAIADEFEMSKRTLTRYIDELKKSGFLKVEKYYENGKFSYQYIATVPESSRVDKNGASRVDKNGASRVDKNGASRVDKNGVYNIDYIDEEDIKESRTFRNQVGDKNFNQILALIPTLNFEFAEWVFNQISATVDLKTIANFPKYFSESYKQKNEMLELSKKTHDKSKVQDKQEIDLTNYYNWLERR